MRALDGDPAGLLRIRADVVASSTAPCGLDHDLIVHPDPLPEEGACVAVRVLQDKDRYNEVECVDGTFRRLRAGLIVAGALGRRRALRGYSGHVPDRLRAGQRLHLLNMGGIVGECTSDHPDLGPALSVELLGAVLTRSGATLRPARLQDHALPGADTLPDSPPLVMVSGTSMNTGKTGAATCLIEGLTRSGLCVAAAKLTGAALLRDVAAMRRHGAVACATFADAGRVSTVGADAVPAARGLVRHLAGAGPDVLVLELGDGFIGDYGVDDLLRDPGLATHTRAHVVAAGDLAGAWAAEQIFRTRYGAAITVMTGPVTDNEVGCQYIRETLGLPARNALRHPELLVREVEGALRAAGAGRRTVTRRVQPGRP